jgi:hypothetical protein
MAYAKKAPELMPTVAEVIKELKDYGLDVSPSGAHWKVRDPKSGAWLFDVSKTPSDYNWYWGLRRHLRRIGVIQQEISDLKKRKNTSSKKRPAIDLVALKHAQDQAAASGGRIPMLSDLDDSTEFFSRIKTYGGNTSFSVNAQEEAIAIMPARAGTPRLNHTKQRLTKFFENWNPDIPQTQGRAAGRGKITEFVRIAVEEVAPARNIRAWKSIPSGVATLTNLKNNPDAGMTIWVVNLAEATMDHIEGLKWGKMEKPEEGEVDNVIQIVTSTEEQEVMEIAQDAHEAFVVVEKDERTNELQDQYVKALIKLLDRSNLDNEKLEAILSRLDKLTNLV